MKKHLLHGLYVALLLGAFQTQAQTITEADSKDPGVSTARLDRIDTVVNDYIGKGRLNGAVSIVVKDGRIIQYKAYGYADVESKRAMRRDDLFRIASQTKALTSTAIMILYEEGKLRLDEPISDFIPTFAHPGVLDRFNAADSSYTTTPAKREITIIDLLTHSSGIDYAGIGSEKMRAIYAKAGITPGFGVFDGSLKEKMTALGRLPLIHQPGERWTYGLNMDVLGAIVEIISGKSLEAFLTERIFQPLGMKDTYFNVPPGKAGRLVTVYMEDSLHHVVKWTKANRGVDPDYPLHVKHYFSGGADLTSTAYDYAIFLQMLLNGGTYNGARILSPRTVELMTTNQLGKIYNDQNGFGLGFEVTGSPRGPRNIGSFSWGGFFGTTYWADPKAKLVCLFMTQEQPNSHGELSRLFEQIVYGSLF